MVRLIHVHKGLCLAISFLGQSYSETDLASESEAPCDIAVIENTQKMKSCEWPTVTDLRESGARFGNQLECES